MSQDPAFSKYAPLLNGLSLLVMGLSARDNNVTSEQAGLLKKPEDTATPVVKIGLLFLLLIPLVGCQAVPTTKLKFGNLLFESPKDVIVSNMVASVSSNGTITITIGSWTGKNNLEIIKAITDANAAMLKNGTDGASKLMGDAVAAMK